MNIQPDFSNKFFGCDHNLDLYPGYIWAPENAQLQPTYSNRRTARIEFDSWTEFFKRFI